VPTWARWLGEMRIVPCVLSGIVLFRAAILFSGRHNVEFAVCDAHTPASLTAHSSHIGHSLYATS